ncbi:MAG: glycerophosphodiester phosphodiesterase [Dysgonamonadaceae bacterium]|nr:glycerophosphodiester phosphodiesterase [Dysgonamonadaceae bacterium]
MTNGKRIFLTGFACFILVFCVHAQMPYSPKIICHRGHWNIAGSSQNSIASLAKAQELRQKYGDVIYGVEFDVWITMDGTPVLSHDATIDSINIENSDYNLIKDKTLGNGEKIPTLAAYLEQGRKNPDVKLICEIKTHSSRENNDRAVEAVIQAVKDAGMEAHVEYIAFDWQNCLCIHEKMPDTIAGYLNSDKTPQTLFDAGIMCMDYNMDTWKGNNDYALQTRNLGIVSNVWTVNTSADIQYFIELGVDFLTTDDPELCCDELRQHSEN